MRFAWTCWLGACALAALLVGAFAAGGPEAATERPVTVASALTRTYTISLPRSAPFSDVVLGGLVGDVSINDRASVVVPTTIAGVELAPVVASNNEVKVGADAHVSAVVSPKKVTLRSRATARSVTTSSTLEMQSGATTDSLEEHALLNPAEVSTLSFDFPDVSQGNLSTFPRAPRLDLAPNRYGNLTIAANASVQLRGGSYRFDSLILEPDSTLLLDNASGTIVVLVDSTFIHRGQLRLTAPALSNVLFLNDGTSMVSIEAPFVGTLVAPSARINIDSPSARGRRHTGAFFGRDIILHQDQVIEHRPFRDSTSLPVCDVATFTPVSDFPFDRSRDTDNDIQGVKLSGTHWYFTNANSQFCGFIEECTLSHVWRYELGANINDSPSNVKGNPWAGTYNHFGDFAFVSPRAGLQAMLMVGLEPGGGSATRGAIGFISEDLESHLGFAELGRAPLKAVDQGDSTPWVAFNRGDDRAYSSAFKSAWLNAYEVRLRADGTGLEAVHRRSVRFRDCATNSPAYVLNKQGADFSSTNKLYISVDVQGGGVIVVDPQSGVIRDFARINFDPDGEDEELEGVLVRNLDGDGSSPDGHVHVLMIQNDLSNDNLYFKHLRSDDFSKL